MAIGVVRAVQVRESCKLINVDRQVYKWAGAARSSGLVCLRRFTSEEGGELWGTANLATGLRMLPSGSAAKVSGTTKSDAPSISEAWTAGSRSSTAGEDGAEHVAKAPPLVGKIVPPGHALQLEENTTSRLSLEAQEVVRAFNVPQRIEEDRFVIPESVRKSRTLDAYADVCSEILPGFLYVSNLQVARDTNKLRALGITHVINCCGELKHYEDGVDQPASSPVTRRFTFEAVAAR